MTLKSRVEHLEDSLGGGSHCLELTKDDFDAIFLY